MALSIQVWSVVMLKAILLSVVMVNVVMVSVAAPEKHFLYAFRPVQVIYLVKWIAQFFGFSRTKPLTDISINNINKLILQKTHLPNDAALNFYHCITYLLSYKTTRYFEYSLVIKRSFNRYQNINRSVEFLIINQFCTCLNFDVFNSNL